MSDVDRYQYGYDQNSNRLFKANMVGTPIVSRGLDEYYSPLRQPEPLDGNTNGDGKHERGRI